jgi:hypothetical protein
VARRDQDRGHRERQRDDRQHALQPHAREPIRSSGGW